MSVPKMNKKGAVALLIIVLIVVVVLSDYMFRCRSKPLSRDEAFLRANKQLEYLSHDFVLGDPLPVLMQEQYDSTSRTWMFTFRNSTCEVSIIADRCHGTDVGGVSEGCKPK